MSHGGIDEEYRLSRILKKIGTSDDSRKLLNALFTFDVENVYSNKRAVELLKEWVEPWEWNELRNKGYVTYQSGIFSDVKYQIGKEVHALENKQKIYGCVNARDYHIPSSDSVLAKIISFKKSEMQFINITNWRFGSEGHGQFWRYVKGEQVPAHRAIPNQYPHEHRRPLEILHDRKEQIDIRRVGLISTFPTDPGFPMMLSDACIKYGLAQALIDNISRTEEGLCVRGILPQHDLRDSGGFNVHKWQQGPYTAGRNEIYQTSREGTDNDRKVMILFGARNLKPLYTTTAYGMEVKGGSLLQGVQEMYIQRAHVKIIDIIDISGLQTGEAIWFRTPILFKRNDDMVIQFNIPPENVGMTDNIQLLGIVVEALGGHMTG